MSVVRWGPDSDLYIYPTVDDGPIVCCGCPLMPPTGTHSPVLEDTIYEQDDYTCTTWDEMITHVRQHVSHGDTVPEYVIPDMEQRRDLGDTYYTRKGN